jgi:hypothetical protein
MMALKRAKPRPHPGPQQMPKAYKLQRAPPASPRGSSPQAESQALPAPRQLSSHHQEAMVGAGSSRTRGWRARGRLVPSPCCPRAGCVPLRPLEGRERPEGAANARGSSTKR